MCPEPTPIRGCVYSDTCSTWASVCLCACGNALLAGNFEIPRYCPSALALTLARYVQAIFEKRLELTLLGRTLHVNQALFDKFALLDDHGGGAAADSKRSLCACTRVHPCTHTRMCVCVRVFVCAYRRS